MYKLREFPGCLPQFTYGPSIPGPLSESNLHKTLDVLRGCLVSNINLEEYYIYFRELSENDANEMINILIKNNKISKL